MSHTNKIPQFLQNCNLSTVASPPIKRTSSKAGNSIAGSEIGIEEYKAFPQCGSYIQCGSAFFV